MSSSTPSEGPPPAYEYEAPTQTDAAAREDTGVTHSLMNTLYDSLFRNASVVDSQITNFDELVVHLKFLETLYHLRQSVETRNGLFGLEDHVTAVYFENDKLDVKVSELRWSAYVQRAADRFETWWLKVLENCTYEPDFPTISSLPPLDVLMVWHSYMLNPRTYLEDSLRLGGKAIWQKVNMPWALLNKAISAQFVYSPGNAAQQNFETLTGIKWNADSQLSKIISCPSCYREYQTPWLEIQSLKPQTVEVIKSSFAMKDTFSRCPHCGIAITHDVLSLGNFIQDLLKFQTKEAPIPGSVLSPTTNLPVPTQTTPEFMTTLLNLNDPSLPDILRQVVVTDRSHVLESPPLIILKQIFEERVKTLGTFRGLARRKFNMMIRRMFSCYWSNSSVFSQSLSAAVLRQGSFVEKMHGFDWLHSPALKNTMDRAIVRYGRFMNLIAEKHFCVPTLDIDLVWHTHQLSPYRYYSYTSKSSGTLVSHDDKVAQTKLSTAFEKTAKLYEHKYKEVYSECLCWYCEAVREKIKPLLGARVSTDKLYAAQGTHRITPGAHISTHNAVQDLDRNTQEPTQYDRQMWSHYNKAYKRATKRAKALGRPPPPQCYAPEWYYYGAFYPVPIYGSFPGCFGGFGLYGAYGYGNCVAGTCSAGLAAGSCGVGAGACAAGNCGGSQCAAGAGGCAGGGSCGGGGCGGGGCGGGGCGGGGCGGGGN